MPARIARLQAQASPNIIVNPNTYQDLRWRSVGPHRGGRSTAAAGVRTQPNVFYMGATGGGVWKTENYGITWLPVTDGQIPTGSIGAIDVSDSNPNVVYVGTGSEAIRSNVIVGRGVYKSTDAGTTWQYAGLKDVGQIGQLKIHPKNPDIAYVAAIGQPFGWGPERGVYRTKDGGKTWQKVLFINDQTGVGVDRDQLVESRTSSTPARGAGSASRGRSSAAGRRRKAASTRRPTAAITGRASSNGFPDDLIGKVWVDVAQSNPKVVYAQVEAKGAKGGLYRTARQRRDAGRWSTARQALRARPFYFNKVFVNPKDENDVWVTELGFHHSTDGGKTFVNVADAARRQPRRLVQSGQPEDLHRDQRRRREHHAGRRPQLVVALSTSRPPRCTWSTPTSSSPTSIYGPQQDTGKNLDGAELAADVVGPGRSDASSGFRRRAARAARSGRFRRARSSTATARASSAA